MKTDVECLPECEEHHADGCPALVEEMESWARYFGLSPEMTREACRAQLERMRPLSRELDGTPDASK